MNGSDTVSNSLFNSLTADLPYDIPSINPDDAKYTIPVNEKVYAPISYLQVTELTNGVGGTGIFDALMSSVKKHLKDEYESGRITGADYTKTYSAQMISVLNASLQFLSTRETVYWEAVTAQATAIAAQVQVATGKLEFVLGQLRGKATEAEYAANKAKLGTEDANFGMVKYNLANILPEQLKLVKEQIEVQHAQTSNTRMDGTTQVTGVLGKQKDLYTQQITSYQRDAEMKAVKVFTDAWITMKTIDEGLLPPTNFQNTSLDGILSRIKINNNLV